MANKSVRPHRGKQKFNDPRMNMAFYGDHMKFCQYAAYQHHQSVTAFVNSLIAKEMANYDRAEWDLQEGEIQ